MLQRPLCRTQSGQRFHWCEVDGIQCVEAASVYSKVQMVYGHAMGVTRFRLEKARKTDRCFVTELPINDERSDAAHAAE